jgi:hypothetical protein
MGQIRRKAIFVYEGKLPFMKPLDVIGKEEGKLWH